MTQVDSYRLAAAQNSLAEAARVAVDRLCDTLDLPKNGATWKLCADALRNAAQVFQVKADMDCEPSLGEASTFDAAERGRQSAAAGVQWLTSKGSR